MPEQSNPITVSHPPAAVMRALNPTLRFLLRTPLPFPARKEVMLVNFTGRKSGRQYSIPVSAHPIDNNLYALTDAPWKHNFRDGAAARVVYGGKTTAMRGELIRDPAVVADVFSRCAKSYGVKRAERMMGLKFRDQRVPSLEEFTEAVDQLNLVGIKFTPAT